jgi:5-methyltetrahydropteroyltriglutamate--homocysteine methyltransferase
MSPSLKPPFRADHVGSLLRPRELRQARERFASGRLASAELAQIEDAAIRRIVRMQEDIGLQGVTDGEFRRNSWHVDFFRQIGGVEMMPEMVSVPFRNDEGVIHASDNVLRLRGRLSLERPIFGEAFAFLKSTTRRTAKLTIPSPSVIHRLCGVGTPGESTVYTDIEEFWSDLANVYAQQLERLAALGCGYLQLDETTFAALCDPAARAALGKLGVDGERIHETYIRVLNDALRDRPPGMTVCTHSCRGNHRSSWRFSGPYDFLAEAVFSELAVDGFFLEYDDERSGGFEPLRFVPKGKKVVLGLVTTKRAALEDKDTLKRRVDAAARYLPLEQLCLSPQCGFASSLEGNALTEEEQFAKLRLVVETARDIWG